MLTAADIIDHTRPAPPGLIRLAANFAADMAAIARYDGKVLTPEVNRLANLETCRSNACGLYDATQGRCLHPDCGCFCRAKTIFQALKCPLGLWKQTT